MRKETPMATETLDNVMTIWIRRSFKKRFFSLPWKPWCGWEVYEIMPDSGPGVSVIVNPIVDPELKVVSEITFPRETTIKKRLVRGRWDRAS